MSVPPPPNDVAVLMKRLGIYESMKERYGFEDDEPGPAVVPSLALDPETGLPDLGALSPHTKDALLRLCPDMATTTDPAKLRSLAELVDVAEDHAAAMEMKREKLNRPGANDRVVLYFSDPSPKR
jgi:hypothetical protein